MSVHIFLCPTVLLGWCDLIKESIVIIVQIMIVQFKKGITPLRKKIQPTHINEFKQGQLSLIAKTTFIRLVEFRL